MEKTIFFAPDILKINTLPEEESYHCIKVLRKQKGDPILITDGKGHFFDAIVEEAHLKKCTIKITQTIDSPKSWDFHLQVAFAPTKNMDRTEWFLEKATEIGIDKFSPILCRFSERKEMKRLRAEKILVSAMKQSQKACLPVLDEMISFSDLIKEPFEGQKFIAHCHDGDKFVLNNIYKKHSDALILIGPEGDFSKEEVSAAIENGFQQISLGKSRLRTETASLVACHTLHVLNQ